MRAVISDYVRTPFHRAHKGELASVRPEDMLETCVSAILDRNNVNVNDIEDLMLGCAYPEGVQGLNLGRIATYLPGLPNTIPGMTTNRLCGSSMQVAQSAAGAIGLGSGEMFLAAGVETMSLVKRGGWNRDHHPTIEEKYPDAYISMGLTAENLARDYSISRDEQELFALNSHKKALSAQARAPHEIIPVNCEDKVVDIDGCMRDTSLKMAKLRPASRNWKCNRSNIIADRWCCM